MIINNRFFKKLLISSLLLIGFCFIGPAHATQPLDRIIATVNDEIITERQLVEQVHWVQKEQASLDPAERLPGDALAPQAILNHMIDTALQMQIADRLGIVISEEKLEAVIQKIAQDKGLSPAALQAQVVAQQLTWTTYRQQLRQRLVLEQLMKEMASRVSISDQEVQQALAQLPVGKFSSEDTRYHVEDLRIPVSTDAAQSEFAAAREQAEAVLQQARGGVSFQQLAVGSQAPNSVPWEVHDLGWRKRQDLPDIFLPALQQLQPGKIANPLQAPNGFHLIRLIAVDAAATAATPVAQLSHVRHILMKASPLLSDEVLQKRLHAIREKCLKPGDFEQQAQQYSEDPLSAMKGGDMGWILPDSLDPQFTAQLERLKPGQMSEPFKTSFGWHIVQLIARKSLTADSLEWRKQQVMQQIWQRKFSEVLQKWQRDLRAQAYIHQVDVTAKNHN